MMKINMILKNVISMDEFKNGDKIIQLPCNHIFHKKPIEIS